MHNIHKILWPSQEKVACQRIKKNIKMFLLKSLNHKFETAPNKMKLFLPLSLNSMFPLPSLWLSSHFLSRLLLAWNFSLTVCQLVFGTLAWCLGTLACGLFFLLIFSGAYVTKDLNHLVRFNQLFPGFQSILVQLIEWDNKNFLDQIMDGNEKHLPRL